MGPINNNRHVHSVTEWSSNEEVNQSYHSAPAIPRVVATSCLDHLNHVVLVVVMTDVRLVQHAVEVVNNLRTDFIRDPSISTDSFRRFLKTYLFARRAILGLVHAAH